MALRLCDVQCDPIAIWQSSFSLIAPPDKASRRLFETTSSRKSGTRLAASIKGSPQRDHLREPDPLRALERHRERVVSGSDAGSSRTLSRSTEKEIVN
jgi:hypothetical protein